MTYEYDLTVSFTNPLAAQVRRGTCLLPLELILGKSTYLFGHNTFDKTRQEKKKGVSDRYIWWRPLSLTFTTDNYGVVGPLFQCSGLTSAELEVF